MWFRTLIRTSQPMILKLNHSLQLALSLFFSDIFEGGGKKSLTILVTKQQNTNKYI